MYERFTDRARRVMQLANQEAQRFNHEYLGTEHILLGLVKEGAPTQEHPGVAVKVLKNFGIDLRNIRLEVEKIVQSGPDVVNMGKLPQTPRAKKVIEYAIEEANHRNSSDIGTGFLLLGLLREQESVAAQVLMNLGLEFEDVREEVLRVIGGSPGSRTTGRRFPVLGIQELPAEEFPAEIGQALKELDCQIEPLDREKEAAVAEQDFERAAHLRDQADELKKNRKALILEWRTRRLLDPSWLSWNDGTVAKLACAIGGERRWGDLPILADALEEAGCTDQELLSHCRRPGEHARGCWAIALLLNKV